MLVAAGLALLLGGGGTVSEQAGGGHPAVGAAARPVHWGGGERARPAPVVAAVRQAVVLSPAPAVRGSAVRADLDLGPAEDWEAGRSGRGRRERGEQD